jgi:membrane fusion protein, multidrug efflux system
MISNNIAFKKSMVVISIVVPILLVYIFFFSDYFRNYVSTDNAYINAYVLPIVPQVSGPIITVYIKNYQFVKKGEPLFDIDPAPFEIAVKQADAQLAVNLYQLSMGTLTANRQSILVKKNVTSREDYDTSQTNLHVAQARVNLAKANLAKANLNLQYTHLLSPVDGYVANFNTVVGTMAQQMTSLFSIIDSTNWWVDANFKETELEHIAIGQPATITVDIYPKHTFHGIVENISRGSGASFSLFPAENATGNWVKVTQRFSVKIRILDVDSRFPLRIGASSTVSINVGDNNHRRNQKNRPTNEF